MKSTSDSCSNGLDCLFVHVPKFSSEYLPLGEFINITYMPMGLLALAEIALRHGHSSEVIHLGVEWILDPEYSVTQEFRKRRIRAVGLPLYWHYQSYDVLQVAKAIKRVSPETFVFLGGLTASYFAEEILREFPCIDAILAGQAEKPLLALLGELDQDAPCLGAVPSLSFRTDGEIRSNALYVAGTGDLNALVFADFSPLRHAITYVESFGFPLAFSKEYEPEEHRLHNTMGRAFFPLCVGRGCPVRCSYCGGNVETLRRVNGCNRLLWRDPERVLDDIRRAIDAGYQTVSLCFDPTPRDDEYYVGLFERIRNGGLKADLYFENWALPTPRFLDAFARTFDSGDSYIAYSPDSANEQVRRLNKGFFYTNEEMLKTIRMTEERGIPLDVFFSLPLPGETLREAMETRDMMAELRDRYSNIRRLMAWSVQLEPGSPQYERPAQFDMVTARHCFMDFYRAHGGEHSDTYSSLGFKINHYFGDDRDNGGIPEFEAHIQHLKCMEFCFLSPDPRKSVGPADGRRHCLERRRRIAKRRGVAAEQSIIGGAHKYAAAREQMRAGLETWKRPEWVDE